MTQEHELCIICNQTRTTNREDGQPICATCSNEIYFRRVRNGEIVELKIDMRKVRQSTFLQIQALIQRDTEEHEARNEYLQTLTHNQEP